MSCLRQTAAVALMLLCAAMLPECARGQAMPRYPLTEQFQQFQQSGVPGAGPSYGPPTSMPARPGVQTPPAHRAAPPQYAPPPSGPQQFAPNQPAPSQPAPNQFGPNHLSASPDPRMADPRFAARPEMQLPQYQDFPPAQVLARVGDEVILAGDLLGRINQMLEPALGRITDEELARNRTILMQRMLPMMIETKMVYLDFKRSPAGEHLVEIKKSVFDQYDEKQLKIVMEKAGVSTAAELDAKLRSYGSSLYKEKCSFFEQVVGQQMVQRELDLKPKVSVVEMREYYQQHLDSYRTLARVRWEELMARFDQFPTRQAAAGAIADMGNEVLRGAPFAAVARHKSQGFTAEQGGYHDWTAQGSLVSKPLDEQLFTLPVARLSPIIADEQGLHIVRVIERQAASQVPFLIPPTVKIAASEVTPNPNKSSQTLARMRIENSGDEDVAVEATVFVRLEPTESKKLVVPAYGSSEVEFELAKIDPAHYKLEDFKLDIQTQTRIEAEIRLEKIHKQRDEYLAKLRARTPVWTIFGNLAELEAINKIPPSRR